MTASMHSRLQSTLLSSSGTFSPASLRGKSVLITGGASGIGEACLRAFVSAGSFVTIGDIDSARGEALVSELGTDKVAFARCDTRSWDDQLALFKLAVQRAPAKTVDVVFANAGVAGRDEVLEDAVDERTGDPMCPDRRVSDVNYMAVLYSVRLALHYFRRQSGKDKGREGGGERDKCLILTGSMASYWDAVSSVQYHGSKFGVRGIMRCLRRSMPAEGGRVNLIAPW